MHEIRQGILVSKKRKMGIWRNRRGLLPVRAIGGGGRQGLAFGARPPERGGHGVEEAVLAHAGADARVAHRRRS